MPSLAIFCIGCIAAALFALAAIARSYSRTDPVRIIAAPQRAAQHRSTARLPQ